MAYSGILASTGVRYLWTHVTLMCLSVSKNLGTDKFAEKTHSHCCQNIVHFVLKLYFTLFNFIRSQHQYSLQSLGMIAMDIVLQAKLTNR